MQNRSLELRRRDGSTRQVRWSARLLRWEDREYLVQTVQDVTDEMQRREELRRSEERYRSLFEDAPDPIVITTEDGEFVRGNEVFHELTGYGREELIRLADLALHRAKEPSGGSFHVFNPSRDHEAEPGRLAQEQELQRGFEAGEFVPSFQPVVRLSAGEIVAAEVLARWRHPGRGLLPPGEFIGLAGTLERTGIDPGSVVAEGIETEAQSRRLRTMGCRWGQGYRFARPMPADEFGSWLDGR